MELTDDDVDMDEDDDDRIAPAALNRTRLQFVPRMVPLERCPSACHSRGYCVLRRAAPQESVLLTGGA